MNFPFKASIEDFPSPGSMIFHSYATDLQMCHQGYENDGGLNPEEQLAVVWAQWTGPCGEWMMMDGDG